MIQWRATYEQERLLKHAAPEILPAFVELTAISRRIGEQLREPMYRHLHELGIAWSEMEDKLGTVGYWTKVGRRIGSPTIFRDNLLSCVSDQVFLKIFAREPGPQMSEESPRLQPKWEQAMKKHRQPDGLRLDFKKFYDLWLTAQREVSDNAKDLWKLYEIFYVARLAHSDIERKPETDAFGSSKFAREDALTIFSDLSNLAAPEDGSYESRAMQDYVDFIKWRAVRGHYTDSQTPEPDSEASKSSATSWSDVTRAAQFPALNGILLHRYFCPRLRGDNAKLCKSLDNGARIVRAELAEACRRREVRAGDIGDLAGLITAMADAVRHHQTSADFASETLRMPSATSFSENTGSGTDR